MEELAIAGILIFFVILGLCGAIYYFFLGERGRSRRYVNCMCSKYEENSNIDENVEGNKCFKKIKKKEESYKDFITKSKESYPELWEDYDFCK
jgi:hypothetical protein